MPHTKEVLDTLIERIAEIEDRLNRGFDRIRQYRGADGSKFDLSVKLPNHIRSGEEVEHRGISLMSVARTINAGEYFISDAIISRTTTNVNDILSALDNLNQNLDNIDNKKENTKINSDKYEAIDSSNNNVYIRLNNDLLSIDQKIDSCIDNIYKIVSIIRSRAAPNLAGLIRSIQKAKDDAIIILEEIKKSEATSKTNDSKINSILADSNTKVSEISRLLEEATKSRRTLSDYEGDAAPKINAIRELAQQSDELSERVEQYKSDFAGFQTQLDRRNTLFEDGERRLNDVTNYLNGKKAEIDDLNKQATDMLQGATVAGLAGEFGRHRDKLNRELGWARWVFYLSILTLTLSALPLAFYVLPIDKIFEGLAAGKGTTEPTTITFSGVLARLVLLLPGAWFARFAAARHATLFRLKEHYAYKHSLAASVEGFKKQSKEYASEIAAATFHELATLNPAAHMEHRSPEVRAPNPALDWIMKKIKATHDGG